VFRSATPANHSANATPLVPSLPFLKTILIPAATASCPCAMLAALVMIVLRRFGTGDLSQLVAGEGGCSSHLEWLVGFPDAQSLH